MSQNRPIVLIEDDSNDIQMFRMAMSVLNVNAPLHCCPSAQEAIDFLDSSDAPPGLILCRYQLAAISGIDLREKLSNDPSQQRIPFILFGPALSDAELARAFELPVQGLFIREASFGKYLDQLDRILKYWSCSVTPASPRTGGGWK